MVKENRRVWKAKYFERLAEQLNDYDKCFIVNVDNVRSNQMQKIRISLRGEGEVVMGKNTMMKKVITGQMEAKPSLEKLLGHINQNVGLVFTKSDLSNVRETIEANKVEAPAKAGQIAQCDVTIPKQNTGMGPEKTSFFQALQIQTKITRGTIEIVNDVPLIKKGDKVGASEATLLGMLGIHPFSYGLVIKQVFDQGSVYSPEVLDITPADVLARFQEGVRNVAAVSLAADYPTAASVPHSLANAFRKCLAISVATDYTFKEAEQMKEYLKDPSKFASAAPAAAAKTGAGGAAAADTKAAEPEESEEESDEDIGMGLFD